MNTTPTPSAPSGEQGKPSDRAIAQAFWERNDPSEVFFLNMIQRRAREIDARELEHSEALERKHEQSEPCPDCYAETTYAGGIDETEQHHCAKHAPPPSEQAGISDSTVDGACIQYDYEGIHCGGLARHSRMRAALEWYESAFPRGVWSEHVRKLVGKLEQWSHCMSYNESYFGEPAGLVKSTLRELAHAIDPIYPTKTVDQPQAVDPLAGIVIHTATASLAAHPAPEAQAEKPVGRLNVSRFRGSDAMVNTDFDYLGDLPDGNYPLYLRPQPSASETPSAKDAETCRLWCLRISGPDDVHPAPSKAHAQKAADLFNAHFKGKVSGIPCSAAVEPWPHSAESHAEQVESFCEQWLTPKITANNLDEVAVAWNLSRDTLNILYNTLQHYANRFTYLPERIVGVLAGCPRGKKPPPDDLVQDARLALEILERHRPAAIAAQRKEGE